METAKTFKACTAANAYQWSPAEVLKLEPEAQDELVDILNDIIGCATLPALDTIILLMF